MSLMWLQVGQCGNQIGQEWWQILANNGAEADRYPYFSRDGLINAICVDSEPKVIRRLRQQVKKGQFRDANIILGQRGRGNNWAYGKKRGGPTKPGVLLERTMESFRKELERRDCYSGTVILHSLCGGTGSGLGSRLCQEIRDNYPAGHLLSVTTAPHETGDTPLQHYNSLLCLSYLQRWELMWEEHISVQPPMGRAYTSGDTIIKRHFYTLIRNLCSPVLVHISTLKIGHSPCSGCDGYFRFFSFNTFSQHHSLSVLAVARNSQEYSFLLSRDSVLMKLKQSYHCVSWNPFPIQCWTDPQNILDPSSNSHSLTVCANHSSAGDLVSGIVGKSHTMYNAGGYLHWYRRYGCEDEDFQAAFNTLDSVVEEYNSLGQQ
ncbi:uncharacterized protein [Pyxicephalus adspersus]|uniref:uncharacterized protein n=1 Tax=Pyxicephalus adspersus TaxID=30357 RepID=UPI003B59F781